MASTGDVELPSHGYQVLRRPWEIIAEMINLIKSSETTNPCSVSRRLQVAGKIQEWKKINGGRIRRMVRLVL